MIVEQPLLKELGSNAGLAADVDRIVVNDGPQSVSHRGKYLKIVCAPFAR
jgi:hypothetical protein